MSLRQVFPLLSGALLLVLASSSCEGCAADRCASPDACARDVECSDLCAPAYEPLPVFPVDGGDEVVPNPDSPGAQEGDGEPSQGDDEAGAGTGDGEGAGAGGEGEGEGDFDGAGAGAGSSDSPCAEGQPEVERCSFEDEDCDGEVNEELDCTFLAASAEAVWRVDPFTGNVEHLLDVYAPGAEVLFDVDIDVDGSLLATAGRTLYRVADDGGLTAISAGALPFNPNGLAVASDGSVYVVNHDTLVDSRVVHATSSSSAPQFFSSLSPWHSSGDCVHHKGQLFISGAGGEEDELIVLDTTTAELSAVGGLGASGVMGMSSAFGLLFGVTNEGGILLIDSDTGASELLHTSSVPFTGAATRR